LENAGCWLVLVLVLVLDFPPVFEDEDEQRRTPPCCLLQRWAATPGLSAAANAVEVFAHKRNHGHDDVFRGGCWKQGRFALSAPGNASFTSAFSEAFNLEPRN
jgi:hypothetical protein